MTISDEEPHGDDKALVDRLESVREVLSAVRLSALEKSDTKIVSRVDEALLITVLTATSPSQRTDDKVAEIEATFRGIKQDFDQVWHVDTPMYLWECEDTANGITPELDEWLQQASEVAGGSRSRWSASSLVPTTGPKRRR